MIEKDKSINVTIRTHVSVQTQSIKCTLIAKGVVVYNAESLLTKYIFDQSYTRFPQE